MKRGKFWYPARVLHMQGHRGEGEYQWRVKLWYGNKFATAPAALDCVVDESEMVDELWNELEERQKIRVRLFSLASI